MNHQSLLLGVVMKRRRGFSLRICSWYLMQLEERIEIKKKLMKRHNRLLFAYCQLFKSGDTIHKNTATQNG
jgi:hypothetical protein